MTDLEESADSEETPGEGQHEHTVDPKGRVSLPVEFRKALNLVEGTELVVTRHLNERGLLVFWKDSWTQFRENLNGAGKVKIRRVLIGSSRKVRLDALGRIQIPVNLRNYADLSGKCYVMGQSTYIEMWSMAVWDRTHEPEVYVDEEFDDLLP